MNLANAFTIARLCLAPLLTLAVLAGQDLWVLALLAFAAATDMVDGWVARRMATITRLGTILDPIADKLVIVGTLMAGAHSGRIPSWLAWSYLAKETMQLAVGGVMLARRRGTPIKANWYGKTATTITFVGFFTLWIGWSAGWLLVLAGLGAGVWAAWNYLRVGLCQSP